MSKSRSAQAAQWMQVLAKEVSRPVFSSLPPTIRPYLMAALLFAVAGSIMYIGDAALLRYGLPWSLVSLLVIVGTANLWGVRPAVLVLVLSAIYEVAVVPYVLPPLHVRHEIPWHVFTIRTLLFVVCGSATIWLTYRARLMQETAERRREVVTSLQSMVLPSTLADAPGYEIGGLYKPANREEEVGGDFYDFYAIGGGLYGILIGDVMGKGKEAAASTAFLRYSVRAFASTGDHPGQIMRQLNTMIDTQGVPFETASLFLGYLDVKSGCLYYANAGHEPPLLRRISGGEEVLSSTGPILGVGPGQSYEESVVVLEPSDVLLLMTDGVTEARSPSGDFLDASGAWKMLRTALRAPTAQRAIASLDTALTHYIGAARRDDIAILLLRRHAAVTVPPQVTLSHGVTTGQANRDLEAPKLASDSQLIGNR